MFGNFPVDIFQIMFFLVFFIVICSFVIIFIKNISRWNKNNHSPRLTVEATIVSKRTEVSHHNNAASTGMHSTSSTFYHVTFQVASGDRMELSVSGYEYGMLAEGDMGNLSFQGTRYLGFQRK